ncbi:MAG: response regulator [bacterium]
MNDVNLLICEDDEDIAEILSRYFVSCGFKTEIAKDGKEALKILEKTNFNIAFIDIMMPQMNGIDFLKQLKEVSPYTEAIIVTAYSSLDTAISAMRLGAVDYIQKPVELEKLEKVTKNILEKQEAVKREDAQLNETIRKLKEINEITAKENGKLLEEIHALSKFKKNWIRKLSFEIRTPVTIIKGYAQLLQDMAKDDEAKEYLSVIIAQCERLVGETLEVMKEDISSL